MSARSYTFRDAEIQSPALRGLNWAGAGLARVGLEVPSLASEAIIRTAQKRAGCRDLGGESFREPLDRYLAAVRDEAD